MAATLALLATSSAYADYPSTVVNDGPLAYYRLSELPPQDVATNSGSGGTALNGIHSSDVQHWATGALVGNGNKAAGYNGASTGTTVPYSASVNPQGPFTVELWVKPNSIPNSAGTPCPISSAQFSGNRSGWQIRERDTGYQFVLYNHAGSGTAANVLGGGTPSTTSWTHLVGVYDGTTAYLYVNGALASSSSAPGFVANDNSGGAGPLTVGFRSSLDNAFDGAVDEAAVYTSVLSASQILAHYQNGTSASPGTPYNTLVLTANPIVYLRLDETGRDVDPAYNRGSLGSLGDGIHHVGVIHAVPGALAGSTNTAVTYQGIDQQSDDGGSPTTVDYNPALNPSGSFSVEAWLLPTIEGLGNAQCPMVNRFIDANGNRFGWDFFQRTSGEGWNFRMFNNGTGSSGTKAYDITGGSYTVGAWCHLVAVYNAPAHSATLYLNGVQVAQQTTPDGSYFPNTVSPLAIGSFPDITSGNGYENPFIGSIDEFALYSSALTATQVLNHYNNGLNASRSTPYETLVASDGAVEYLRMDEPTHNLATNSGTLGTAAVGIYSHTGDAVAGPRPPAYAGFSANNVARNFDGISSYVELSNPDGLNFYGQITVEAWIQPAASQNGEAYIIAHGGNNDFTAEDALRIENGTYQVLSYDGNGHDTGFSVPSADLGTAGWVHLAGTYDGGNWNLYRNGVLVSSNADFTGQLPVANANWAIGARGRWKTFMDTLDRQFKGGIDEPAIYNYALAPGNIQAHYFMGKYGTTNPPPNFLSQPVSRTEYAGGAVVFNAGAEGGSPLSYQWKRNGAPISGATDSTLGLINVQPGDAANYSVTVSNPVGTTNSAAATLTVLTPNAYGAIVMADQPVAYYPLNETSGTVARDLAGIYDGTYQSNPTLGTPGATAYTGSSVAFDGSSQYVLIGNPDGLNFTGLITMEAWIKPSASDGNRNILEHGYNLSPFQEVVLRIQDGNYQVNSWDGTDHIINVPMSAGDLNNWVHLVGTYDGVNWNLYRNGALIGSQAYDTGAILVNGGWGIGAGTHAGDQRFFPGNIDEVALYNHALSADRVQTHYLTGIYGLASLTVTRSGNTTVLNWPAGILQQADLVTGPYTDVAGAISPYTAPAGPAKKFYRLRF